MRAPPAWAGFVLFTALFATALAMGAPLAHLLELPNKIALSGPDYFVVQRIYAGWNRLGFLLLVQLVAIVALIVIAWRQPPVLRPAIAALLFLAAAQAIFWGWTFPANVATQNWTVRPDGWATLRQQWEYSHAAGAICQILAMVSLILAALGWRRGTV